MAGYDLEGALQSGISHSDIAATLAPKLDYDLEGARKAGIPDADIATALAGKFNSTVGGAAVGNPNIQRQGAKAMRDGLNLDPAAAIGGAAGISAGLGAFSKEILGGAGNVIGALPYPAARTVGGFLKGAGQVIGAGGRAIPAIGGAISGGAGETAGQVADMTELGKEYPFLVGEGSRLVGGSASVGAAIAAKEFATKVWARVPKLSVMGQAEKAMFKAVMEKLDGGMPQSLNAQDRKFIESQVAAIRGGPQTNEPLEQVGSIMGDEGKRLMDVADQRLIAAQAQAAGMKPTGVQPEMADVGGSLQSSINTRYKGALDARRAEYAANEKSRDAIVTQREGAGQSVDTIPEYKSLVKNLKAELKPGLHSPDVASDFENILNQISTKAKKTEQPFGGMGSDPFAAVNEKKPPVSFQQIDEVRRQLGEVFRGKPPEGYKAIDAETARKYYGQLSDLQKKYAGTPQAKLLDDYAERTEGLNIFSSKYGKKSTALDQYREDTFATDPSSLPASYFKTRASVQALKELTGNQAQVNNAALEFANKELTGKDAAGVRTWLGKNSEWLSETGPTRTLIDRYATKLEGVERSRKQAESFVAQAVSDKKLLVGKGVPAVQAKALIESGDAELWRKIAPAMYNEPAAKTSMVNAVRQVVANQATAKATGDLFSIKIRPFLEGTNVASKAEMDFIAQKLASIQAMKLPEQEKLGIAKSIILQAAGGWAASAASRTGVSGYEWSREKMVPQ